VRILLIITCMAAALTTLSLTAQPADAPPSAGKPTIDKKSISYEAALAIARVGMKAGQEKKSDVAVAVVDQSGILLVLLRADNGTQQFVEGATQKAWTSVNFRASTRELFETIKKGKEDDTQLPFVPKALFLMGGVPLKHGDRVIGAVGAAGCVSGMDDDYVAQQAVRAFTEMLKQ